jgi:DNA-binding GntR family transcriptional regulator
MSILHGVFDYGCLAGMARTGTPTQVERVYAALRSDILGGRQRPGVKLPFAELVERYRASMGVVREALTRLQGEGLVESAPQYGFSVVRVSADHLRQLTEARCSIESLVLSSAIAAGDLTWESELLAAHHRLDHTPQREPDDPARMSDGWARVHGAFHHALLAGSPNLVLLRVALSLRSTAEVYQRLSVPGDETGRDVSAEHRAILDATLDRDAGSACALLVAHIQRTTDILLHIDFEGIDP